MDFASADLTMGQVNAIVKKLGGQEGAMRFLRGETVLAVPTPSNFAAWKTVRLGTSFKTADAFHTAFKSAKMNIGNWADDILDNPAFTVSETEVELYLVNVSVRELGFQSSASRRNIIERALSLGFELCPLEIGPQLRLQYPDQPKGERLLIGMEPIVDSVGLLCVFCVEHDDDKYWLSGYRGDSSYIWFADDRFVFVRPRK